MVVAAKDLPEASDTLIKQNEGDKKLTTKNSNK